MFRFNLWHDNVPTAVRFAFCVAIIGIISFLHPNAKPFQYEFEKGQAWRHADLLAPVDYAIEKPEAEYKRELQRATQSSPSYYQYLSSVETDLVQHFKEQFHQAAHETTVDTRLPVGIVNDSLRYLNLGKSILHRLYSTGIAAIDNDKQGYGIYLVRNNTVEQLAGDQVKTIDDAAAAIRDTLNFCGITAAPLLYPMLKDALQPNIVFSDSLTNRSRLQRLSEITQFRGMVKKGELIIAKGSNISDEYYQKLLSLRNHYEQEQHNSRGLWGYWLGYFVLTSVIISLFLWYIHSYFPEVLSSLRQLSFLLLLIMSFCYVTYFFNSVGWLSIYAIPFCIVPIVVANFYGARLALITHFVVVLIASYLSGLTNIFTFTFIQLAAGMSAVLSRAGTRSWSRFFFALEYIFLAYALSFIGLQLIREGNFMSIEWSIMKSIGLSVFLTLLANPIIPIVERLFGFTTAVTLTELNDLEHPLLKEMSINAPGTLQHSLQVANLAEAAATAIGANALLIRVAALYHDIGKMIEPTFYIENQTGESPHEGLTAEGSAQVIIGHVTKGVKIAKKHKLPAVLHDFILTHHGTTRVEYFWRAYETEHKGASDAAFRYPGPRPRTREGTLLMLADSIEAASKSLQQPNEQDIELLVEKIVSHKISLEQLDESKLSFKDLETAKAVFKKLLKSINHVRLAYPTDNDK